MHVCLYLSGAFCPEQNFEKGDQTIFPPSTVLPAEYDPHYLFLSKEPADSLISTSGDN